MKFSDSMEIPRSPFIWLLAMTKAAAEENPAVTGTETNSTREPKRQSIVLIFFKISTLSHPNLMMGIIIICLKRAGGERNFKRFRTYNLK